MSTKKSAMFDRDYTIRIFLISIVCISIVILAWSYKFKTDEILSIDENNTMMFEQNFLDLQDVSQYGDFKETNISKFAQRKVGLTSIDRALYSLDRGVFTDLPAIPSDWSQRKFLFDNGRFYGLKALTSDYYLQPEFYDDWQDLGISYFEGGGTGCKAGFFGTPSSQRIYTKAGADIETYMIVRSSFCDSSLQPLGLSGGYPSGGTTDDGIKFVQNPDFVRTHISLRMTPTNVVLGRAYPVLESTWAQKVSIVISVSKDTPRGLYVVSLVTGSYFPNNVLYGLNLDAYKSKGTIANFLIGVD
jgi:hypothetical protein